jgi:hypothetical protein
LDVVLGVAVTGRVAQLALVGSAAADHDVVDQSVVDLADDPIEKLTETVVGTKRLLADENHRLVATRLCWSDYPKADQLRRALEDSGVQDVVVVAESQAATALSGTAGAASSISDDPTLALARGAAMAAGLDADATAMAPAVGLAGDATAMAPTAGMADATAMAPTAGMADAHAREPQLAYSMANDGEALPLGDEIGDEYYEDDEAHTTAQRLSGRSLLISNAVVAFAVIGFASLAVAVAISVRPTAASQPVVGHQNAAPGKFMPLLPTQQQAPVPSPPPDQPNAGYQGGIIPDTNGYIPPQLMSPGGGGAPAAPAPVPASPGGPGTPGFVPNPNGPIPIPIIIPFPGRRPQYPPYTPPIGPTTTYPTPPTITPSTPTITPLTPTYPTSTPSAPSTPSTPTNAPPTSSKAPYTSTQAPTSAAPPSTPHTTAAPPHTQTQQTVAPKPTNPQPVIPQPPHGGHH